MERFQQRVKRKNRVHLWKICVNRKGKFIKLLEIALRSMVSWRRVGKSVGGGSCWLWTNTGYEQTPVNEKQWPRINKTQVPFLFSFLSPFWAWDVSSPHWGGKFSNDSKLEGLPQPNSIFRGSSNVPLPGEWRPKEGPWVFFICLILQAQLLLCKAVHYGHFPTPSVCPFLPFPQFSHVLKKGMLREVKYAPSRVLSVIKSLKVICLSKVLL